MLAIVSSQLSSLAPQSSPFAHPSPLRVYRHDPTWPSSSTTDFRLHTCNTRQETCCTHLRLDKSTWLNPRCHSIDNHSSQIWTTSAHINLVFAQCWRHKTNISLQACHGPCCDFKEHNSHKCSIFLTKTTTSLGTHMNMVFVKQSTHHINFSHLHIQLYDLAYYHNIFVLTNLRT